MTAERKEGDLTDLAMAVMAFICAIALPFIAFGAFP
jgi:hypothetical protein